MVTVIFLSIVVLILLYNAIEWEANDIKKIYAKPNVYDISDPVKREDEYKFYATFNNENHIMWRSIFITSVISTVIIYLYLKHGFNAENVELSSFVILLTIFLTGYLNHIYRNFHIYRVMASKVRKDYRVMETIGEKKKLFRRS